MTTLQEKATSMGYTLEEYKAYQTELQEYAKQELNRLFVQAEEMPELYIINVHTSSTGLNRFFKVYTINNNRLCNITPYLKNAYPKFFHYSEKYEGINEYSYTDIATNLKYALWGDIQGHYISTSLIHY